MENYDFRGYATVHDVRCTDGRTIEKDAFKHCDKKKVPLVWNHRHNDPTNVLGHAYLEYRPEGVVAYGFFNDTLKGQEAKSAVQHGDIDALSIYANHLQENGPMNSRHVFHGDIQEVSLVIAGANPSAFIDSIMSHSDSGEPTPTDAAIIYSGVNLELYHSDEEDDEKKDDSEKQSDNKPEKDNTEKDNTEKENPSEDAETVKDVFDTLTEKQQKVVYALIAEAMESSKESEADENNNSNKEENSMKQNVFEQDAKQKDTVLSHSDVATIVKDAKRFGSLKESFMAHSADYGIENIDMLFPDFKNVNGNQPGFIKRTPDGWVDTVMNGVHHTPFSRIKMLFADLREDEARAKGYTKGKLKKEEVFSLLKRTVEPTTVYKKQKIDRDDVNDITEIDVIAWLKGEMRMMLDEEIARAILFGDGRSSLSEDKISETNIIPIVKDAELYTIKAEVEPKADETLGHALITAAVKAQDTYEGSGNTTMYAASSTITDMLLLEDADGRRMYKDMNDLALAMNVNRIVKVPASIVPEKVYGVIVDLNDYNVGADKGGAVSMFDDFDIDYNQMKYLIETRCSGALIKPYSAIVLTEKN